MRCPYLHFVSADSGLPSEKTITTTDCKSWMCETCGFNPKVEAARKRRIRIGDWNKKAVIVMGEYGPKEKILQYLRVRIAKEPRGF